ncbi:MAG TPA: hypothetical protein VNA20_14045 [Frankiaceae bacterium]|nr:hypothetical protein [Frankiaceae bacterium]
MMKKTFVTMAFAAAVATTGLPATASPPCHQRPCVMLMCDPAGNCDCIWFDVAGQRIGPIC